MTSTWVTEGMTVNVDATSSYTLRGAGDPINSQVEMTNVNLAPGAMLTLNSLAEFTEQGADIYVNGVSFATDPSILSIAGTTGTAQAIPEPSGTALIGLAGLAMILRRRR